MLALEEKFDEKNIELDADLDELTIPTDESLMEIVWNNLLTNAINFTKVQTLGTIIVYMH